MPPIKRAIYLSGGGARGAYQVGVLKAIYDILQVKTIPVDIISSVSAGSINASFLAMYADDFSKGIDQLMSLWTQLSCEQIFKTSAGSLIKSVFRNVSDMVFHFRVPGGSYLLDTTPLGQFLERHIDFHRLNKNIKQGVLSCFEVASSCYDTAQTISFVQSTEPKPDWNTPKHKSLETMFEAKHILASSALPLFFPAVKVDHFHFGDGGLRLAAPLRASIKLGADRILIIGTRRAPVFQSPIGAPEIGDISFAKVFGNIFNALFLDSLDRDLELLIRINQTLSILSEQERTNSKWKYIDVLFLRPREDLGELAPRFEWAMPFFLRYLASAFGGKNQAGDFLSFLLFESEYAKKLIELGYADARQDEKAIRTFFED
jgi:NTE family protein